MAAILLFFGSVAKLLGLSHKRKKRNKNICKHFSCSASNKERILTWPQICQKWFQYWIKFNIVVHLIFAVVIVVRYKSHELLSSLSSFTVVQIKKGIMLPQRSKPENNWQLFAYNPSHHFLHFFLNLKILIFFSKFSGFYFAHFTK